VAKYDFSGKNLDGFAGHFVVHVIGPLLDAQAKGGVEIIAKELDITVRINGVEVEFMSFIDSVQQQMERMIEEKAYELLEQRGLTSIYDELHELEERLKQMIREKLPLVRWE
jgi:hypothetical protein